MKGRDIRAERRRLGVTQAEVRAALAVDIQSLVNLENERFPYEGELPGELAVRVLSAIAQVAAQRGDAATAAA